MNDRNAARVMPESLFHRSCPANRFSENNAALLDMRYCNVSRGASQRRSDREMDYWTFRAEPRKRLQVKNYCGVAKRDPKPSSLIVLQRAFTQR